MRHDIRGSADKLARPLRDIFIPSLLSLQVQERSITEYYITGAVKDDWKRHLLFAFKRRLQFHSSIVNRFLLSRSTLSAALGLF